MNTDGTASTKDDLLSQIFSVCTTLTEEAMAAASAKAKEAGFDPNRGMVPLPESFINLSSARATLEDAIEKQKLVQLPITVQKELFANLETIAKSLQGLTAGVDEVVNLTSAIELLNTSIWKYGFYNLSDQVLGHQKKLNQLKNQELQIAKLVEQLDGARRTAERSSAAATDVDQRKADVLTLLEQVKQHAAAATTLLDQVKDADTQTSTLYASIQQHEKQSGELTSNIKTASNELSSLGASIKTFYGEVDEYRKRIAQTSDEASKLITTSESTLRKATEDAIAKVDGAIASFQAASATTVGELNGRVTARIAEAADELSSLATDTKTGISTFKNSVDEKLKSAIDALGGASAKLVAETEEKAAAAEQQLHARS